MSSKKTVDATCDECGRVNTIYLYTYECNCRRNGHYRCNHCRPQNTKEYWQNPEVKKRHSDAIRSSEVYRDGIANRDLTGERNGMTGRVHTIETRKKMSIARTGKLGSNATAWKGGKSSVLQRLKKMLQTRSHWFSRVFERDASKCTKCGANTKLDAHHIIPLVVIVKSLLKDRSFDNDDVKLEWLYSCPEVLDQELKNGITLCRQCHRKIHNNWGSHDRP